MNTRRAASSSSMRVFAPALRAMALVDERRMVGPGGKLRLRVYRPRGLAAQSAPAAVMFHGGGWVIGSLDTHEPPCRALADDAPCVVLSVDYRLAPEHPFPATADDATAAFRWVAENAEALGIDSRRIAFMGDSACGNLAAVVGLDTRDDARRP